MNTEKPRDHGSSIDAATAQCGGQRAGGLDLSTGINSCATQSPDLTPEGWQALPDARAGRGILQAARSLWRGLAEAITVATSGTSSMIAQIPALGRRGGIRVWPPGCNERSAAFRTHGCSVAARKPASAIVAVTPNNPDGRAWSGKDLQRTGLRVIDASFADADPAFSLIEAFGRKDTLVLKSFSKFWRFFGLRLGFTICDPALITQLRDTFGRWTAYGPAFTICTRALRNEGWANQTRGRLARDAAQREKPLGSAVADTVGGTTLFWPFQTADAFGWQDRLARSHIWSRMLLRPELPRRQVRWDRFEAAL